MHDQFDPTTGNTVAAAIKITITTGLGTSELFKSTGEKVAESYLFFRTIPCRSGENIA